jgi:outer membrane protein assembly factor BamA
MRDTLTELVAGFRPVSRIGAFVRVGYLQVDTGPGSDDSLPSIETVFDDTTAPGLDEQPDFLYAGATVLLEGRDRPANPHRGALLALYLLRLDSRGSADFDFWRVAADARAYFSLGSPARVLALRATALADEPHEGARVPFYLQETLGGSHALRGFLSFRFRSERLAMAQVEYRWEAWPALEFAAFWEGGAVRRADEPWTGSSLETSYGIGLRLKTFEAAFLRLDLAWSDERTRLLLRFNPSF